MSKAAAILSRMQQNTRWTAGILLLVMLASAFVPIALAQSMPSLGKHCLRRKNAAPDKMPCHGAMAKDAMAKDEMANDAMAEDAPSAASSNDNDEPSLQPASECCGNHDCCCQMGMSESARILAVQLSSAVLACNRNTPSHDLLPYVRIASERDSARAPPV